MSTLIQPNSPLDQLRCQRTAGGSQLPAKLSPQDRALLSDLLGHAADWVHDPIFEQSDAEQVIMRPDVHIPAPNTSWYHPVMENLSSTRDMRGLVNVVLKKEQEQALFLQYNYARYRAALIVQEVGHSAISIEQAKDLLRWYRKSRELRDRIAQFNLALVLAMAKRVRGADLDFADLISEGNMALLRAIDKFNVAKGFKFSTYACRAILKAFSRTGVKYSQYKAMFPTDFDPALEKSDHKERRIESHESDCASEVRRIFQENHAELSDVEQAVIEHRFALGEHHDAQPLTLEQVGKLVGLTKERVRQIQNKALAKLRLTLEAQYLDGPHAQPDDPTPATDEA